MTNPTGPTQEELSIRLELPIESVDARRRGIDASFCLMLLRPLSRSNVSQVISALLERFRPKDSDAFICTVNSFNDLTTLNVSGKGITIVPEFQVASASSAEGIETILRDWKAEAHVIFFGNYSILRMVQSAANAAVTPWWRLSRGGHERRYLEGIGLTDPLFFFSESHGSLEIIGTRGAVLRCLGAIPL